MSKTKKKIKNEPRILVSWKFGVTIHEMGLLGVE